MAIESLIGLALFTVFLAGLAWYASTHRANEQGKRRNETDAPDGQFH